MTNHSLSSNELLKLGIKRDISDQSIFIQNLKNGNVDQRRMAARALGWLRSSTCTPSLIEALNDFDSHVRRWVVASLSLSWSPEAELHLHQRFQCETVIEVRAAILRTLGWHRLQTSALLCIDVLQQDVSEEVRAEAIKSLGRIDAKKYLNYIIHVSNDSSALVRRYAVRAMISQSKQNILLLLLTRSVDQDAETRAVAIRALGEWPDHMILPHLIRALKDSNPCVRLNAILAIKKYESLDALNILKAHAHESHLEVKLALQKSITHLMSLL